MISVWIVYWTDGWEYSVQGVFSTEKKAKEAKKVLKKNGHKYDLYEVYEHKIDTILVM